MGFTVPFSRHTTPPPSCTPSLARVAADIVNECAPRRKGVARCPNVAMLCCRKAASVDPGPWPGAGLPIPYKQGCCCSRLLFTWFTPLIAVGATRPLTEADSWVSPLPDQCSVLTAELSRHIARIQEATSSATRGGEGLGEGPATRGSTGEGRWVLLRALVSVRWRAFCLCALLKLTAESLDFAGPLLLGLLLQFVQNPASYDPATPYCVAGAIFLAAALRVVVLQNYVQLTMHIGANRGTAAMGVIYRKVLTMRVGQVHRLCTLYTPFIHLYCRIYTYVHPLYMYIQPYIHHIYT